MLKTFLMLCMVVVFASPAFSEMKEMPIQENKGGNEPMMAMNNMDNMGELMEGMMKTCIRNAGKLGLTEDQINKLIPIRLELQKREKNYKADLKAAQLMLMNIIQEKNFALEKATTQLKRVEDIKTMHQNVVLKLMLDARYNLTDDQFMKMRKIKQMEMEEEQPAKMMMEKK